LLRLFGNFLTRLEETYFGITTDKPGVLGNFERDTLLRRCQARLVPIPKKWP